MVPPRVLSIVIVVIVPMVAIPVAFAGVRNRRLAQGERNREPCVNAQ